MKEGNVFSLFTLCGGRGVVPIPGPDGRYPILLMERGERGLPHPRSRLGVPHARSGWGVPLSRSRQRVPYPRFGWGVTHPADRGYPVVPSPHSHPRLDGAPTIQDWMGYLSILDWNGYPPSSISKVSTCYPPGGVPLAFKQEDFLVLKKILEPNWNK